MTQHEARTGDKTMHGEVNQCDGCASGAMLDDDGIHRAPSGHPMMICQRERYAAPTPEAERPTPLRELVRKWRDEATKMRMLAKVALERGDLCGADESSDCASELDSRADELEAALSLPAAQDGWVMVPREPTPEMLIAVGMMDGHDVDDPDSDAHHIAWWKDMIAATPNAIRGDKGAEAVAWFTDDHLWDRSATTYDPVVAQRWREKGWPVSPLYAAPTQAAAKDTP